MKKKKANIIPKKYKPRSRRRKALERYFYLLLLSFSRRFPKHLAVEYRKHAVKLLRGIFNDVVVLVELANSYNSKKPKEKPKGFRITKKIQRRPRHW